MAEILQRFKQPITIIGGGEFVPEIFNNSLKIAPELVAVDGGINYLNPNIHTPKWIIGDLDSAQNTEAWAKVGTKIKHLPEQEKTDFEKCLYSIEATAYFANGFLGHRVDHTLAACSTLVKNKGKNIILLGKRDLIVHVNRKIILELEVGTRLSLFPFQKVSGVKSLGLKYSISGLFFSPESRIGTSNEVISTRVEISFDGPGILLILPIKCLFEVAELYKFNLGS